MTITSLVLLCATAANAQFGMDDWPGSKPVKRVGGPDASWNGANWQVAPGGTVEWSISVANDHFDPAVLISIQDDLPDPNDGDPLLPFNPATDVLERPGGSLEYNGDWLSLLDAPLFFGESFDLRWVQTVDPAAIPGTEICNLAFVGYLEASDTGEPVASIPQRWRHRTVPEGADAPAPICFVVAGPAPNLAESWKEAVDESGDGILQPGETVTYTITVRNTGGQPANDVVVIDTLPPGLRPLSASEGGLIDLDTVTWDSLSTPVLDRVRTVDTVVLQLTAVWEGCLGVGELLCNQAVLSSSDSAVSVTTGDPSSGPGTPTCLPTARPVLADSPLSVSDLSGDGEFLSGEELTWSLSVTNSGTVDATDIVVDLPIAPWIVDIVPLDGGSVAGGTVTWTSAGTPALARLASGESTTLRVNGRIDPRTVDGEELCGQATLSASGCAEELSADVGPPVAAGPTCLLVAARAELSLELLATDESGDGLVELGELLEYELRLRHVGGGTATDVTVVLSLPVGGPFEELEADNGGLVVDELLTWSRAGTPELTAIGPGGLVVLTGRGRVGCAAVDGAAPCATARATGPNLTAPADGGPTCSTLTRPVLAGSPLVATEADGDGLFELGEPVRLDLLVTNSGSSVARDVTVVLPLAPEDLDVVASGGGLVLGDRVEWSSATTPALSLIAAGGSVGLSVDLRLDPAAVPGRSCRQAELRALTARDCGVELSDDPALPGTASPTCYDVGGEALPPTEVPDGDPSSGGPVPVRLRCEGIDLRIEWAAAARAITHHVYRGPMSSFGERPWTNPAAPIDDPENAELSCELTRLDYLDEGGCALDGQSLYVLVIGRNLIGDGPVGEQSIGPGLWEPRVPVSSPCP